MIIYGLDDTLVGDKQSQPIPQRLLAATAVLLVSLVICNIAFIASNGWARFIWGVLGYGALFLSYWLGKLAPTDIGLATANIIKGLKLAGGIIAIILVGLILVYIVDKGLLNDPRYHQSLAAALGSSLILLPLKTVLFEETAFRGVLLGLLLKFKNSRRFATLGSSIAFGLWHISSATKISSQTIGGWVVPQVVVVLAVVVATTVAGIFFCELRWRSKSLVAPIAVHWFLNGFATILAALTWA